MFFRKTGFPEDSEIVLCTVTKIHSHSVFVNLDEYDKSGMIHISEIAPGRIRNIREHVRDGKKVVCKVLRISQERGHIDLSLRRVNDSQRRLKVEQIKQEQVAEKIVENVARLLKKDTEKLYLEIGEKIAKKYEMLHYCFNDIVAEDISLTEMGVDKKVAELLEKEVRKRIQPIKVSIDGDLKLISYDPNGVDVVKKALIEMLKQSTEEAEIKSQYLGAGKYKVSVTAPDYKEAEAALKAAIDTATGIMEKSDGTASFERVE